MHTHTIRNKSKKPIFSYTPKFFEIVKTKKPEAFCLMNAYFVRQYFNLTGKTVSLDHDQGEELLKLCGAENGVWKSKYSNLPTNLYMIKHCFETGFMRESMSLDEALEIAQLFYETLDSQIDK